MHYSKLCISDGWMSGWQDEQVIMPIKEIEINMYMDVDCMDGWGVGRYGWGTVAVAQVVEWDVD